MIFDLINFLTAKRYNKILTVSRYIQKWLIEKYHIPKDKIVTIYNGVSPDLKPKAKDERLLRKYNLENKFVLLFMGLLIDRKNPMFLLEVFKSLKSKYPNIALIICGRGPLEKAIIDFVRKHNLKDVILTGQIMPDQKLDYLNLCDVFILPSKNEGFGLVVAEAMGCRKAVIVSDNSSLQEIVTDGENGILAKTDNTSDWTQKLEELLTDKKLREKLGENAYRKAKNLFNWGNAAQAHQELFKKLINA